MDPASLFSSLSSLSSLSLYSESFSSLSFLKGEEMVELMWCAEEWWRVRAGVGVGWWSLAKRGCRWWYCGSEVVGALGLAGGLVAHAG